MINYSVIIPHYKDLDGLKALIPTIPDRNDIQVLIIDDNSFPNSDIVEKTIKSFNRDNISIYYNDINKRGAGGCRNIGISHSDGEWLIFSDADDCFTKGAFSAFDNFRHNDADIVYFHMTSINLPEGITGTRHLQYDNILNRYHKNRNRNNELCLRYNYPSPCAKMVRAKMVIDNHISFDDVMWSNDDMFSTKCGYYAKKIEASNRLVYCAIRKNGTITTSKSNEAFKTSIDIYINKILYLKGKLSHRDFRKSIRWPGNKVILSYLNGYDVHVRKYILQQYKDHRISLMWFNLNDFIEVIVRIKSYFNDRKYTGLKRLK